jgi:hypothetical protein
MSASSSFEAQYRGTCQRCFLEIEVGELVRYVDDELMHVSHQQKEQRPEQICDQCYLVRPCEHDEN